MNPYVAEIRIMPTNFAPKGWALCDGQILPISQNTALFSLLGTTFGGDGLSNFALPNLQGAAPMMWDQGPGLSLHDIGESGGEEVVTLLNSETPNHNHQFAVDFHPGSTSAPSPTTALAGSGGFLSYQTDTSPQNLEQLSPAAIIPSGGNQPHNNMMPYLTLNFCIALQGVYPPRT